MRVFCLLHSGRTWLRFVFASRRLGLSGCEASVPVYVYDTGGWLVVLKTIRESVEVVDVPADGLYFVRIGKESFKVIL